MKKRYIKMNDNDNYLSLGNLFRLIKKYSQNKKYVNQIEIFTTIFNIDDINESTINNYCLGARSISSKYIDIFFEYKYKYEKNKNSLIKLVVDIISLLDGYIYTDNEYKIDFINNNKNLSLLINSLYNIAKNDKEVKDDFTKALREFINKNDLYSAIIEILFYIILSNKQPLYIEDKIKNTIENKLANTNISIEELNDFLNISFNDGINYVYSLKKLAKNNNAYACFELGYMEFNNEFNKNDHYLRSYNYLSVAAEKNHPRANYLIAKIILDKKIGSLSNKDIHNALIYLNKAIELGNIAALNLMGLYQKRFNHDEDKAIEYFNKAIIHDYVYSYNNLGKIYEEKGQYEKAFSYYIKSANYGEGWACNKVGYMYQFGIGYNIDLKKAFEYYNKALEAPVHLQVVYTKYNLAKYFYKDGIYELDIPKNESLYLEYLNDSANKNHIDSILELLSFYINKYKDNKTEDLKNTILNYLDKLENHPQYNDNLRIEIEKNLKDIKKIDRNLL